jgi:PIN domain nuclease of toxin-antitoxin system
LLDTHSLLWFICGSDRLTTRARQLIEDLGNERFVSAASLWEIAIKVNIGKLTLTEEFGTLIPRELHNNAMTVLPVKVEHLSKLLELPLHHRDPFDRLLAAQALAESLTVVSADDKLDAYGLRREW